jgi:hypothetical protein
MHLIVALWASRKPHVLIGIEKEAILGWLLAKLCHCLLFPMCHCSFLLLLDESDGLLELTVLKRLVQRDHRRLAYSPGFGKQCQIVFGKGGLVSVTCLFYLTLLSMHVDSYGCFAGSSHTLATLIRFPASDRVVSCVSNDRRLVDNFHVHAYQ